MEALGLGGSLIIVVAKASLKVCDMHSCLLDGESSPPAGSHDSYFL